MAGNNTNIVHIETIENLCISIQAELKKLEPEDVEQQEVESDACDYLHLYQVKQVKALRDAYQDN